MSSCWFICCVSMILFHAQSTVEYCFQSHIFYTPMSFLDNDFALLCCALRKEESVGETHLAMLAHPFKTIANMEEESV